MLKNAQALQKGLRDAGLNTLCGDTESHLVLARLPKGTTPEKAVANLGEAGFLVKGDEMLTADESLTFPILRLSTLDPTTRALKEPSLQTIGHKYELYVVGVSKQGTDDGGGTDGGIGLVEGTTHVNISKAGNRHGSAHVVADIIS